MFLATSKEIIDHKMLEAGCTLACSFLAFHRRLLRAVLRGLVDLRRQVLHPHVVGVLCKVFFHLGNYNGSRLLSIGESAVVGSALVLCKTLAIC